jgi:hypothetical protein
VSMVMSWVGGSRWLRSGCVLAVLVFAGFVVCGVAGASSLPAGWGYELISPADAGGESINGGAGGVDGEHAWISLIAPVSNSQISGNATTFAATRTSEGWRLRELADPAQPGTRTANLVARSSDSQRAIVSGCPAVALGCQGTLSWERVDADGTRTTLVSTDNPDPNTMQPVGVSDDLSRMIISTDPASPLLAQDTHTLGRGLYSSHDGALEFLGLDPSGAPFACGAILANDNQQFASEGIFGTGFEQNGLSADGQTVVLASPDPDSGCPDVTDLYVRRDGQTVNISAPRNGNPDEGALYSGNTRDGNTIYFTTTSRLVDSDTDSLRDIYAYDRLSDTVTAVTQGADIQSLTGAMNVVVSPGGDDVYFVAGRALAGTGSDGAQNLYRAHDGTITHIATTTAGGFDLGRGMADGHAAVVTPDGQHLLFLSDAPLTGQPTGGQRQLFQYAADSNAITCISCRRDGATPHSFVLYTVLPFLNTDQRLQSDDGATIVFNTREGLLAQDTNGTWDAYLWKAGALYLLSSGHSSIPAIAVSTTADGEAVYFTANDGLTAGTSDSGLKLYTARDHPFPPPVAAAPDCQDDACQGPPTAPPSLLGPASSSFAGPGNTPPAPAAKALTRAQKLKKALRACKHKPKRQRSKCRTNAHKRYGTTTPRTGRR